MNFLPREWPEQRIEVNALSLKEEVAVPHKIKNPKLKKRLFRECHSSQTPEPLIQGEIPKRPGEARATNLFAHEGKEYLAITDKYSGWLDVNHKRMFNRKMETELSSHPQVVKPFLRQRKKKADRNAPTLRAKAKEGYGVGARTLSELKVGDIVCVQHQATKRWDLIAEVKKISGSRKSYLVLSETGRLYWRNRRFLRPYRVKECKPPERSKDNQGHKSTSPRQETRPRKQTDFFRA